MGARKRQRDRAEWPAAGAAVTSRRRLIAGRGLVAGGLGLLLGGAARAQDLADFRVLHYGEGDGRTQVWNPRFYFLKQLGEKGQFSALLSYDSISGASPTGAVPALDGTTSASGSAGSTLPTAEFTDQRRAIDLGYTRRFGSHLPSMDISYSKENDYVSSGLSIEDSVDILGGTSTLHFGLGYNSDQIDPIGVGGSYSKNESSLSVGWTQVLSPRDLLDGSIGYTAFQGYLTDPYKVVTVGGVDQPEVRPDSRDRWAVVFKYAHAFGAGSALKTRYRYYTDDWAISAHSLEFSLDQKIGRRWIVTPRLRLHQQSQARFFEFEFDSPQQFMSADYRLSSFWNAEGGLAASVKLTDLVSLNFSVDYLTQTGLDRYTPRAAAPAPIPAPIPALIPRPREGDEGGDGGGPSSISAADLTTLTTSFGLAFRF